MQTQETESFETLWADGQRAYHAGQMEVARAVFARATEVAESFDEKDERKANAWHMLACASTDRLDFDDTDQIFTTALKLRLQAGGFYALPTAATLYEAGQFYQRVGLYTQALSALRGACEILSKIPPPDARLRATALCALGLSLRWNGELEESRERLEEALALCDASDASYAPLRASILGVLATVAMFTRDHAAAERALEECVRLHDAVDGLESGVLAQALQALGEFRARQGSYPEALEVLMRACLAYEQASGVDVTLKTTCLRTLAQVEAHLGMWEEACGCLLQVIDRLETRLGKDHPEIAEVLVECGNIYVLAGQASKAASLFERALSIVRGESDSPQGEACVSVVRALGAMHYREGDLDEAQAFFERALDIRSRNAETDGLQLAESYRELAAVYTVRKRTAVARPLLKRALAAYKNFFVPRFAEVAATYRELACTWRKDGNLDAEEQALQAALQAQTHAPSGEGLATVDVLLELADVSMRRGSLERADAQRKKAAAVLSETIAALRSSGRTHEAEALERQMHEINSKEEEA